MAQRKRGDTWQFVIEAGRDQDGKRIQIKRSGYPTKKAALDAEIAERNEMAGAVTPTPAKGKLTVGAYLGDWLAGKADLRPSSATRYDQLIRYHLTPHLGGLELKKLRPVDVQACYRAIVADGLSSSTARSAHVVLREALEQATRWGMVPRNVAALVDAPAKAEAETYTPTIEEVLAMLDLGDRTAHGPIYRLLWHTGARLGEVLALRWHDVGEGAISITATAHYQKGQGVVIGQPKTASSSRLVMLDDDAIELLARQRRRQAEEKMRERLDYVDNDLVFADALGRPLHGPHVYRVWQTKVSEPMALHVRLHDLRHAHATAMLQAGVNLKIVSERLGHSSIEMTANLYTHVAPTIQADAVAAFEALTRNRAQA